MITGDYHHTAVAVAKTVGMVKPDSQVVIIDTLQKEFAHSWSPGRRPGASSRLGSQAAISDGMSPLSSPQPSFRQRDQEVLHADSPKTPQKPQLPVVAGEAQALATTSVEAKRGPSLGRRVVALEAQGFSTISVEAKRGPSLGRRMSFDAPKLMQLSASSGFIPTVAPVRTTSPSSLPSEIASCNRQLSEAAVNSRQPNEHAWLNRLPSGVRLSPKNRLPPLSISFEVAPERLQSGHTTMRRSVSLSRLPSQFPTALASLLLDSTNDDSAMTSSSPTSPSMQHLLNLNHCLSSASGTISHPSRRFTQDAHPSLLPRASGNPLRGLTFTPAGGRYVMDPHEALTAMSEGCMQCAVTGHALEYLLQLPDVSLLETVLRNAVVFSRMQVRSLFALCYEGQVSTASCCPFADIPGKHCNCREALECSICLPACLFVCACLYTCLCLRNKAVVSCCHVCHELFAMQPYQKGQVMDLLGSRGIQQPFNGRLRHIQVML